MEKSNTAAYYIHSAIGVAIMVLFGLIPPPAPITPVGMSVLGIMLGLIYLWTFVDMVWPSFAAMVMFGFQALAIYPNSWQTAGIHEAGMEALGNWIAIFALGCMILTVALQKTGLIRRITFWFITRKVAKRSSFGFSAMFLTATLVISSFLDCVVAQFLMLGILHEIFDLFGFKKGDAWPRYMVMLSSFTVIIAFAMTPICHTAALLFMAVYTGITGTPANMLSYMAVGLPVGILIFLLMLLYFRFVLKVDMSRFGEIDMDALEAQKPGDMSLSEKIVATVCATVLVLWLIPGFLAIIAPASPVYAFMSSTMTDTAWLFIAIALLSVIHVEGRPILNLREDLARVDWGTYLFLASMMMIATSLGEDATGIGGFIAVNVVPLVAGMSPFMLVTLIAVMACIVTNFFNNIPVGIIFTSVGVPLALEMGIDPFLVVVAICIGGNMAFTIPPAFVPIGVAYADPYCKGSTILKNGLVMTLICVVVLTGLIYPLGSLFL